MFISDLGGCSISTSSKYGIGSCASSLYANISIFAFVLTLLARPVVLIPFLSIVHSISPFIDWLSIHINTTTPMYPVTPHVQSLNPCFSTADSTETVGGDHMVHTNVFYIYGTQNVPCSHTLRGYMEIWISMNSQNTPFPSHYATELCHPFQSEKACSFRRSSRHLVSKISRHLLHWWSLVSYIAAFRIRSNRRLCLWACRITIYLVIQKKIRCVHKFFTCDRWLRMCSSYIANEELIYDTTIASHTDIKDMRYLTISPWGDTSQVNEFHSRYQIVKSRALLDITYCTLILIVVEMRVPHLSSALIWRYLNQNRMSLILCINITNRERGPQKWHLIYFLERFNLQGHCVFLILPPPIVLPQKSLLSSPHLSSTDSPWKRQCAVLLRWNRPMNLMCATSLVSKRMLTSLWSI